MKILVIGKNGQVGARLAEHLSSNQNAIFIGREQLDLSKPQDIPGLLKHYSPDLIMNGAAFTHVDQAESHSELAFKINAEAVAQMAQYAAEHQSILYHYSTDYVFDGENSSAYLESDITNPLNVYGQSKLAGEQAIINSGCKFCIFRTTWVYSPGGGNFIHTILNILKKQELVKIVNDQRGAPTSADFIARMSLEAVKKDLRSGIYHLTNSGSTTWYDYARYFVKQLVGHERAKSIIPISSAEYQFVAKRPQNSQLNNSLLSKCLNLEFPFWEIELDNVLKKCNKTPIMGFTAEKN
jgi:dTDP-4-dehydrorhamnose reductase